MHSLTVFNAPPLNVRTCRCGSGWCPLHGTDHLSDDAELLADELLKDNSRKAATRVVRRQIEDYDK